MDQGNSRSTTRPSKGSGNMASWRQLSKKMTTRNESGYSSMLRYPSMVPLASFTAFCFDTFLSYHRALFDITQPYPLILQ